MECTMHPWQYAKRVSKIFIEPFHRRKPWVFRDIISRTKFKVPGWCKKDRNLKHRPSASLSLSLLFLFPPSFRCFLSHPSHLRLLSSVWRNSSQKHNKISVEKTVRWTLSGISLSPRDRSSRDVVLLQGFLRVILVRCVVWCEKVLLISQFYLTEHNFNIAELLHSRWVSAKSRYD